MEGTFDFADNDSKQTSQKKQRVTSAKPNAKERADAWLKDPRKHRAHKPSKDFVKCGEALSWQIPPASPEESGFRHGHWKARRNAITQHLMTSGTSGFALDRWINCGSEAVIQWSEQKQKYRIRANYCHCRHCEPCMRAKANKIVGNLRDRLKEKANGRSRFIPLTMKPSSKPLKEQLDRLYKCFKHLRATPLWKESQRGGAATLEVKWNHDTREWHPHLHLIAEGEWLDQNRLSAAWHKETGDSWIVGLRALRDEAETAQYSGKYLR